MKKIAFFLMAGFGFVAQAQVQQSFTRRDSLRGGLRPERTAYDVLRYDLNIRVDPDQKTIVGFNDMTFSVVQSIGRIQIDLFENMHVDSIVLNGKHLNYTRDFDAVFINTSPLTVGSRHTMRLYYSGKPLAAARAPWDGGFVFTDDGNGKPWIASAVQGTGASLWFPCKDSQTDEPNEGATLKVAVPNGLMDVSNGRFIGSEDLKDGYTRWDWEVKNPINNYDIAVNIADYAHIHDDFNGLDLDYYVLRANADRAKIHFEAVKPMLDCFQTKFGAYPFPEDGYKLVETPYLGMEHQSAVAYGNDYQMGYRGSDLSGTGIGLLFDFIIVHESGHEWFGNSITSADVADMWLHESFTCYSESVYVECQYGKEKAIAYVNGLKRNVQHDRPIIGQYGVGNEGSGDMYYKGALMLNTIRSIVNDDEKWWAILLAYASHFKHQIVTADQVVAYFNQQTGLDLTGVFDQYLKYTNIPVLEVRQKKRRLDYRWMTDVPGFEMPVELYDDNQTIRLNATNEWQSVKIRSKKPSNLRLASDRFYASLSK